MRQVIFKFFVAAFLTFTASNMSAQSYNNAIGLRLGGYYNGITYKQFLNEKSAFEITGAFRSYAFGSNTFFITGTYQFHSDIPDVENLRWYVGGGATLWTGGFSTFGLTGVLGLDYTLDSAPINFGLDWSPTFFLREGLGFQADYFALSVRYVLGRK